MKLYNIKSNKTLFDKWMKLTAKTNKKVNSMFVVQNDMEVTTDELNLWFKDSKEDIQKVSDDFNQIVRDLLALREETVKYLKAQLAKEDK